MPRDNPNKAKYTVFFPRSIFKIILIFYPCNNTCFLKNKTFLGFFLTPKTISYFIIMENYRWWESGHPVTSETSPFSDIFLFIQVILFLLNFNVHLFVYQTKLREVYEDLRPRNVYSDDMKSFLWLVVGGCLYLVIYCQLWPFDSEV